MKDWPNAGCDLPHQWVVDTIYIGGAIAGLAAAWMALGPVLKLKKQPEPLEA